MTREEFEKMMELTTSAPTVKPEQVEAEEMQKNLAPLSTEPAFEPSQLTANRRYTISEQMQKDGWSSEVQATPIASADAQPGNVIFHTGAGKGLPGGRTLPGGDFIFKMGDGTVWMQVKASGEVYVRGSLVDTDKKVYECFREWLSHASIISSGRPL